MSGAFGKEFPAYGIEPVGGYGVGLAAGLGLGLGLEVGEPEQQPPEPLQSEAMAAEIANAVMAATRVRILIMAPVTEAVIFGMSISCRSIEALNQSG